MHFDVYKLKYLIEDSDPGVTFAGKVITVMTSMVQRYIFLLLLNLPLLTRAQDTIMISEVQLSTSLLKQSLQRSTVAAAVIDSTQLHLQTTTSLVAAFNAVAGVRMEERSPGSYRLSLRGSLLRSPFGVRNVKVYLDDYPLTDAGGNTYLNVLATGAVNRVEILKGPDGSLFGANSGGVVNIKTYDQRERIAAELAGGSYGLVKGRLTIIRRYRKHLFSLQDSYQRSDGYRQNSALRRLYLQVGDEWQYAKNRSLKGTLFYSDLYYQTPGGLTQAQYDSLPRIARPATAVLPGAVAQHAAVYNKMLFTGITHETKINKQLDNITAVFATAVNFRNPFITNYELRKENTFGARSFFTLSNKQKPIASTRWEYTVGAEWQETKAIISNYANLLGNKGNLLAAGNILSSQHFIFNRIRADINSKLIIEAGLSANHYAYHFRDSAALSKTFKLQWMPRLAISFSPLRNLTIRSSVSRGYSPPTTAEVRPSDNNIYTGLQPETGLNKEAGLRYSAFGKKFWIDVAAFHYRLSNAIVQRQNANSEAFFANAGTTTQDGIEIQSSFKLLEDKDNKRRCKKLQLLNSSTLSHFRFGSYVVANNDYSGNRITGVPARSFVSGLLLELRAGAYIFIQHNHTSGIPLNDANSVYASSYNLLAGQSRCSRKMPAVRAGALCWRRQYSNERYSLGNDLNAAGNRFFNAAPGRNYFFGFIISK